MHSENPAMFDIQKIADEITSRFPDITWEPERTDDCISLTLPNMQNPRFPLIVSIYYEEGIFVDLSPCGSIAECLTEVSDAVKLIHDVLHNQIAVAIAYPDGAKYESQILASIMRTFPLKNEVDVMDFEEFIRKISKPRSFLRKLNAFAFHGIIEISDWSGKRYYRLYRA